MLFGEPGSIFYLLSLYLFGKIALRQAQRGRRIVFIVILSLLKGGKQILKQVQHDDIVK